MTTWKKVQTNSNLVQHETDNAILIKLPKSDFVFWHPAKCVRFAGKNNYLMTISFTDTFTFKCFKMVKVNKKIAEMELTPAEFEAYFV